MLHRAKVLEQLTALQEHMFIDRTPILQEAYTYWNSVAENILFKAQVAAVADELALPLWYDDSLAATYPVQSYKKPYRISAVDGSQIFPDRHAGSPCFLINIGTIMVQYRMQGFVELTSQPYVFTGNEEREGFYVEGMTPETISAHRHMLELRHGFATMQKYAQNSDIPSLLACDGSLIFWHLASKSVEIQHYFAAAYMSVFEELYRHNLLVACYISLPHSKELVNLVRFARAKGDGAVFKTLENDMILDKDIVEFYVDVGARTTVFKSTVSLTRLYPDHLRPHFFYMHLAQEVVRVEIPAWIACDRDTVDLVASLIMDQIEKNDEFSSTFKTIKVPFIMNPRNLTRKN